MVDGYEIEIHKKFALAVACFVFVLLGAPIALRFPRGGVGLTIGVSLFVFALYYIGLTAGAAAALAGDIAAGDRDVGGERRCSRSSRSCCSRRWVRKEARLVAGTVTRCSSPRVRGSGRGCAQPACVPERRAEA